MASLRGFSDLLANKMRGSGEGYGNAFYSMLVADYILRVRVAAIDSIVDPYPEYTQYRAVAEVLDTLKGGRFINAAIATAPSPAGVSSTVWSGSREISITREGRSTSSFMRSTRLVPPAMNFALGSAAI